MQLVFKKYNKQSIWIGITFAVIAMVLLTLMQDYISSTARQGAYYFSESFLFSSFWWLFAPLVFFQLKLSKQNLFHSRLGLLFLVVMPVLLHLIIYPLLVALLSALFYNHTFRVTQTLEYAVTNYADALLIIYFLALVVYKILAANTSSQTEEALVTTAGSYASTLIVSFQDKKLKVAVNDILCLTASKPYVLLQTQGRNYLYSSSLRALSKQLDPEQFLRIHKSSIINLKQVISCASRANGDYDLTLTDGAIVRLSRTYAKDFKEKYFV